MRKMFLPPFFHHFALAIGTAGLIVFIALGLVRWRWTRSRRLLPKSPPGHWMRGNQDIMSKPYRAIVLGADYGEWLNSASLNL